MTSGSSNFDRQQKLELLVGENEWKSCTLILKGKQIIFYQNNNNHDIEESTKVIITLTKMHKAKVSKIYKDSFVFCSPPMKYVFRCPANTYMISWVMSIKAHINESLNINMFKVIKKLGEGKYGKVKLCIKLDTREKFAIKSIKKNMLQKEDKIYTALIEKDLLKGVMCPFIVTLYYAFQSQRKFFFCLEYAPGGDLFSRIKRGICFDDMRLYIAEISLALNYLHEKNYIYRDLKPENVLFDSGGHIKLTDFGLSKQLKDCENTSTFCGTTEYLAPEIVNGDPYSYEIDWWCLGILVFEMCFKRTPFYSQNQNRMLKKISEARFTVPDYPNTYIASFIEGLLEKRPEKRFGFNEVKNHPFMEGIDFAKVYNKEYIPRFIPQVTDDNDSDILKIDNENTEIEHITDIIDGNQNSYGFNIPGFSYNCESNIIGITSHEIPNNISNIL